MGRTITKKTIGSLVISIFVLASATSVATVATAKSDDKGSSSQSRSERERENEQDRRDVESENEGDDSSYGIHRSKLRIIDGVIISKSSNSLVVRAADVDFTIVITTSTKFKRAKFSQLKAGDVVHVKARLNSSNTWDGIKVRFDD
jgi:Domain of unknown function (DUF5666)